MSWYRNVQGDHTIPQPWEISQHKEGYSALSKGCMEKRLCVYATPPTAADCE
jgi:hypothetical protein